LPLLLPLPWLVLFIVAVAVQKIQSTNKFSS
jgi:hypothetical protein